MIGWLWLNTKKEDVPYWLWYNLSTSFWKKNELMSAYKCARNAAIIHRDEVTLTQLGQILIELGVNPVTGIPIKVQNAK